MKLTKTLQKINGPRNKCGVTTQDEIFQLSPRTWYAEVHFSGLLQSFNFFLTIIVLCVSFTKAQAQIIDSSFYEWSVYEIEGDEVGKKECYIVSNPKKSITNHVSRQTPYFMITRYQHERTEEVSIFGGFDYKKNGFVFVFIDGKQYKLYTKQQMAWAQFKDDDVEIIQKVINSGTIRVRSDSDIGTFASDEYSTKGIARAYARMKDICK